MGFPPQSWFGYKTMGIHGFLVLYQSVVNIDRKYFDEDFWNVSGYFGADHPESFLKSRLKKETTIKAGLSIDQAVSLGLAKPLSERERGTADAAWKSIGGQEGGMPVAFQLEDQLPDVNFMGGDLVILSGKAKGKTLQLTKVDGDNVVLGPADPSVLVMIKAGDDVIVDNSNFLAVQTYHRHQVPGREFYVWDQFRNSDGTPLYPQRPMLLGPMFTMGAAGVLPTGRFKGKMILIESLWDREAFPWQADWYNTKVRENLGSGTDNCFRLWYTDHALHGDVSNEDDPTRTVSYLGVLHQALRDLSAWVEKGIEPALSTNYKIDDGQVIIPKTAAERRGIQPVVSLLANKSKRADVRVGDKVKFEASVELLPGSGKVVAAAWNFEGLPEKTTESAGWNFEESGVFPIKAKIKSSEQDSSRMTIKATYRFIKPGTYFPTLRVATQRDYYRNTPFGRLENLDRVRVVVK